MNQHRPYLTLAGASTILGNDGLADSQPVVAMGTMVKGHETPEDIATFQLLVRAYNAIDTAARIHGVDARELALTIYQNPHLLRRMADLTRNPTVDDKGLDHTNCSFNTGIDGSLTAGQGALDGNGLRRCDGAQNGVRPMNPESILYATMDPDNSLGGKPVPALTTLLYKVCDNDEAKFAEATRLVELFIAKALETR